MVEFIHGSPGMSLNRLLLQAPSEQLVELLDPQIYSLLQSTAPDVVSNSNFASICTKLIDTKIVLNSQKQRNIIFKLLDSGKASELVERIGCKVKEDPNKQLLEKKFDKNALKKVFEFFGIEDEERAPQPLESEIQECNIEYGLFPHQRDVARRSIKALEEYPGKALLHMPTGSGKTRTAMNIVAKHLSDNEPTLICWLAQSAELLGQAAAEFQRAWRSIGNRELFLYRFWGKYTPNLEEAKDGILIAGFSKLYALYQREANMIMRLGDRVSLIIVDEAHQAIAPTYKSLIESLHTKRPTNRLLGLSATPGRSWNDMAKDAKLSDFFDQKKITLQIPGYSDPVTYLEEKGYLAKPTFSLIQSNIASEFRPIHDTSDINQEDYSDEQLEQISLDSGRNQMILAEAESLLARHRRVILFSSSVMHAKLLVAILVARGYDADFITGETPISLRERIIRKFKASDNTSKILCNYGVLTTGFDAPLTSAALIARPTRSLVLYSQMVGRVIRGPKQGGNASAEIITMVDPSLPGFGSFADAFTNWDDVWIEPLQQ